MIEFPGEREIVNLRINSLNPTGKVVKAARVPVGALRLHQMKPREDWRGWYRIFMWFCEWGENSPFVSIILRRFEIIIVAVKTILFYACTADKWMNEHGICWMLNEIKEEFK